MKVLGLSAFYHDSAAALLDDGQIVAAAQEERFTRKKHDSRYPENAIRFCLDQARVSLPEIDHVAFYDKPFTKFERLFKTYLTFAPRGFRSFERSMPVWLKEKLFQKNTLVDRLTLMAPKVDWNERILFSEHHQSHAASAFFPSPFERAAVLTMDGVGEWATTSVAIGNGNRLEMSREILFPHSIGLLYSAFTYFLGFQVNSGEYKVMGLAPYGSPVFAAKILDNVIDVKADGSFRLAQEYFDYCAGSRMTSPKFHELFEMEPRDPESPLTQRHMDLAASIQAVTEEIVLRLTRSLATETGESNLCLAGGVALNCVANGKVLRDGKFKNIWVQPAAGDSGGALGAALAAHHIYLENPRHVQGSSDQMRGSYLGPEFSQAEIECQLRDLGANFEVLSDELLLSKCVENLKGEKALGWFQGRMEFGPRALGARSILADPRSANMQTALNLKVKYRESFRPFAPSVLAEDCADWFELGCESPYMLLVADVAKEKRYSLPHEVDSLFGIEKLKTVRSQIPAVTHVDFSARVQTVHSETNPRYHALLSQFKELTGCPVLVNTSFNVRGEPIVQSPSDAYRCFMGTELDCLAIGNCFLEKYAQPEHLRLNYENHFERD